jgi:hypothetical protein
MTNDYISQQPDEILIKIFLMVGYQNSLTLVCKRFRYITQILDNQCIKKLENSLINNLQEPIQKKPLFLLNNYLMKTYIMGHIFNYYNYNIFDISDTLYDIEIFKRNKIIRQIKSEYKISFNDINKIFTLVINNINSELLIIVRLIYKKLFKLSCMIYLVIDDVYCIVSDIKNNITKTDLKMLSIANLSAKDFSELSDTDYRFYHQQLISNIIQIIDNNTMYIYFNNTMFKKSLSAFYIMVKNSENFNKHLIILKMV